MCFFQKSNTSSRQQSFDSCNNIASAMIFSNQGEYFRKFATPIGLKGAERTHTHHGENIIDEWTLPDGRKAFGGYQGGGNLDDIMKGFEDTLKQYR